MSNRKARMRSEQRSKRVRAINNREITNGASMVAPTGYCSSGKRRFRNEVDAQLALAQAQRNGSGGDWRRAENRYYSCKVCRGFHLTSQPLNRGRGA